MRHAILFSACGIICSVLLFPSFSSCQLSQNSSINSTDTWVVVDLTISNNTVLNLPQQVYSSATNSYSSTLAVSPATQTFHVEAGYDSSGGLVMNFWPTGGQVDPINSDGNPLGFIRFAAGQITAFDQSGAPMNVPALQGIPMNWPLTLLGSNPGSSVVSNLVVPNITNYSTTAHAQLSYANPATTAYVSESVNSTTTAKWTYAQSGSNWIAQQVVLTPQVANATSTRTFQFANMSWHDNATNDAARTTKGYTGKAAPTSAGAIPSVTTQTTPAGSTTVSELGGVQNVAFMHGFFSNGSTWNRMAPWLNGDFRFAAEITPSYSSISSLSSQGTQLYNDVKSNGGSGYILIGHSQGGLISRYAAQQFQIANQLQNTVTGVVTVDTPHAGADLILNGPAIGPVYYGLGQAVWDWVGCGSQWDNGACLLGWLVYNAGPPLGVGFTAVSALPDIQDLTPGSSFLQNLNGYTENFKQAGIVGNTPQRWNEARITWDFLAPYDGIEAFCDPNYYPESGCGERVVASVVGITYDVVEALLVFAILEEIFDPNGDYLDVIEYFAGTLALMDGVDAFWNYVVSGGFYAGSDAIVQSSSQNYPANTAIQYPINGADSHLEATHSPYDHTTLYSVLANQFKVATQASCSFSASPASLSISPAGGTSSFTLNTGTGCQWFAVSQVPWITITSGASGNAAGTVSLSVASNPTTLPRTGSIQAGNGSASTTFTVTEVGACSYSISGDLFVLPAGGGSVTVNVSTQTGCVWSAVPNASWISITAGDSGTGAGSFTISAAPGNSSLSYSGTVTVMNQALTVVVGSSVGTPGTGTLTITGNPRQAYSCPPGCRLKSCCTLIWESGSVSANIGGMVFTANYAGNTNTATVASSLANAINVSGSPVNAQVSNNVITITSKVNGAVTNYSVYTSYRYDTSNFSSPAFTATASGSTLTGGTD